MRSKKTGGSLSEAERTTLWREAFTLSAGDDFAGERERLRNGLQRMRDNVAQLVTTIPGDCKDLTVHDVTHLDALWEMGALIAGPEWEMNPAEAFVFGASVLLHDAGMSIAAFPGGLNELKATSEWKDVAASVLRQSALETSTELVASPPAELLPQIKFEVLRLLHAQQAERMATTSWTLHKQAVTLIEDQELRQAFGSSIGRIAHSHHWSIEKVADKLVDNVGAGTVLPASWSISERKIACLLRCADAAHIDRRRAPTMLYAAIQPQGISDDHWNAQNKINKATTDGAALIYSAGSPYSASDASAWWLAYDLVRIVDKEIRASNALLEEIGFKPFAVKRVVGADSPRALAKHIRPEGWRPIDAEVRVSNPIHLAQTLGGSNLYGHDPLAPVRELLQNAADAVRARRQLEEREPLWGFVNITIEADAENADRCWMHIDDNGIGMTERVLSGPLIDFGKSIWNSSLLREEFPGLQSKILRPIGKFGIGFFSVFELATYVAVVSKKYDAAVADAKVLEFKSISTRPLIRPASAGELPRDVSTRISLRIDSKSRVSGVYDQRGRGFASQRDAEYGFDKAILKLISLLDVQVEFLDKLSGASFKHSADCYNTDAGTFLDELLPQVPARSREGIKAAHIELVRPLIGADGGRYGRAAMNVLHDPRIERASRPGGGVSVGGFTYSHGIGLPTPYIGVIEGSTEQAARNSARSQVPPEVIAEWATEQGAIIDQSKYLKVNLLSMAENIIGAGGDPGELPYCFRMGRLVNYREAKAAISELSVVNILIRIEYGTRFIVSRYSELGANYFDLPMQPEVFVLRSGPDPLMDEELGRLILKEGREEVAISDVSTGSGSLNVFMQALGEVWGADPRTYIRDVPIFGADVHSPPASSWVLSLHRGRGGTAV